MAGGPASGEAAQPAMDLRPHDRGDGSTRGASRRGSGVDRRHDGRLTTGRAGLGDHSQFARGVVESYSPVLGDGHDVLDPHAEPAFQIDPGLDGEAHARLERLGVPLHDVGMFVLLQANAVTNSMDEAIAISGIRDHPAGSPVDLLGGDARPHGLAGGLLSLANDLVALLLLRGRLPYRDRPGHVRAVASHPATEVQDDRVPTLDGPFPGLVMRRGTVRARAHDGEGRGLTAVLDE